MVYPEEVHLIQKVFCQKNHTTSQFNVDAGTVWQFYSKYYGSSRTFQYHFTVTFYMHYIHVLNYIIAGVCICLALVGLHRYLQKMHTAIWLAIMVSSASAIFSAWMFAFALMAANGPPNNASYAWPITISLVMPWILLAGIYFRPPLNEASKDDIMFGAMLSSALFVVMATIALKNVGIALIPGSIAGGLCLFLGLAYHTKWHFAVWLPIVAGGISLILALWLLFGWIFSTERHAPGGFSAAFLLLVAAGFVSATLSWPIVLGLFVRPRLEEVTRNVMATGLVVYSIMVIAMITGVCLAIR